MSLPPEQLAGSRVAVAGAGVSGRAAERALAGLGAQVVLLDRRGGTGVLADDELPPGVRLVVTSPGWRPDAPVLAAARARGVPVWGEAELAWRLRPPGQAWLAVTGTNGKTTTTGLLAGILAAAGRSSIAAGNIGLPLCEAVLAKPAYQVLAVELSSFQLFWSPSLAPDAAALLNVADDHLDWHGDRAGYEAAKARVFAHPRTVAVGNAEDPTALRLLRAAPGRQVTFGAGGEVRVADCWLVDEAFGAGAILPVAELGLAGEHNVANALAALALARAAGVPPAAIREGLRGARPGRHRLELVEERAGIRYVDDSKATNPHAAAAALESYPSVVWIAGGLGKGVSFDDLVAGAAARLRAVVVLGTAAEEIAAACARHAAQVPLVRARSMDHAVGEATRLACPGDTVLLAPAAASMDMFTDYAARGDAFVAAVRRGESRSDDHAGE